MHNFIGDIAFMCSDLLTGKNIPLLIAVSRYPLDPYLLGIMLVAGTATGSVGTMIMTRVQFRQDYVVYQWALRFLNHAISCFLSVWLFLCIAPLFLDEGFALSIMPLFVVITQYVREGPTTPFVLFIMCFVCGCSGLYLERLEHPVYDEAKPVLMQSHQHTVSRLSQEEHPAMRTLQALSLDEHPTLQALSRHEHPAMRTLQALSRHEWYMHRHEHLEQPISHGLFFSIIIFICAFYSSVQHSTTRPEIYVSSAFVYNVFYGGWIMFTSGLIQVYTVMWIGLTHDTTLHLVYAGDLPKQSGLICVWLLCVCLMYSATWNFTQITEQFFTLGVEDRLDARMRFTVAVMACAVWWQTRIYLPLVCVGVTMVNVGTWLVVRMMVY